MKKTLSLILALIIVLSILSGCSKAPAETTGAADTKPVETTAPTTAPTETTAPPDPEAIWYTANDVTEIPDYEGDPLRVGVYYYCYYSGNIPFDYGEEATVEHVVNKELQRITGVEIFEEEGYNNFPSWEERAAEMIATKELPDVIYPSLNVMFDTPFHMKLADAGLLWDLQDLINEENTPILYSMIGPDNPLYGKVWNDAIEQDGGIYVFEPGFSLSAAVKLGEMYPEEYPMLTLTDTQRKQMKIGASESDKQFVYVKQEYLDQLFPGCHSNASWQALLDEKGELTQEDILDIPINSNADFEKLLYDIKAIIDADGSSKYVWASRDGTDSNETLYNSCSFIWSHQTNFTSYFDLADGVIKKSLEQDFWKDIVKQVNKWYRDGILDPEAYGYTYDDYRNHVAQDEYAVLMWPFNPTLCGHPDPDNTYRRVFLNYSATSNKDLLVGAFPVQMNRSNTISLSKGGAFDTEEKVIQFLKYIEFQLTEAGSKLLSFGTPDLGLYTETEDGTIVAAGELAACNDNWSGKYPDNESEALMKKYGLCGRTMPATICNSWPMHDWNAIDTRPLKLEVFLTPTIMFPAETRLGASGCVFNNMLTMNDDPDLFNWWYYSGWQKYMDKAERAASDEEFEQRYQEMLDYIAESGFDDEALARYNEAYTTKYADYIKLEQERNANR